MPLTIRLTKLRLALAVVSIALVGAASAVAAGTFTDVASGVWYSTPVQWAADNEITTGKTATTFAGGDPVTRYEAVTFHHRYDTNVVQPALADVDGAIAALQGDTTADTLDGLHANQIIRAAQVSDATGLDNWDGSTLDHDLTITAPVAGALLVTSTTTVGRDWDETATGPGEVIGILRMDGVDVAGFVGSGTPIDFDLTGFTSEDESVVMHHLIPVSAGTHIVTSRITGNWPPGGLAYVLGRTLTALFVPFDGTGAGFGG